MKTNYGVLSATPINKKLKNGYTLHEWIMRQKGFPAFCMRNISGDGIAIFALIQPQWSINHNWMISFAQTLTENGFTPGFIGNTDSSKNFNFDRQCGHFAQATKDVSQFGALYCATEPKLDKMPKTWSPYCPSAFKPEDMHLWACGFTKFGSIQIQDIYAKNEKTLAKMW